MIFSPEPGMEWPEILNEAELQRQEPEETEAEPVRNEFRRERLLRLTGRISLCLFVLLLFLVCRQWYLGGTIPFIREPEEFEVDRIPNWKPPR